MDMFCFHFDFFFFSEEKLRLMGRGGKTQNKMKRQCESHGKGTFLRTSDGCQSNLPWKKSRATFASK